MDYITVKGPDGNSLLATDVGLVRITWCGKGNPMEDITVLDFTEYTEFYKVKAFPKVLELGDVGYWNDDMSYTPPDPSFRKRPEIELIKKEMGVWVKIPCVIIEASLTA